MKKMRFLWHSLWNLELFDMHAYCSSSILWTWWSKYYKINKHYLLNRHVQRYHTTTSHPHPHPQWTIWRVRREQRMIRRAYRSSPVADPGVSEPGRRGARSRRGRFLGECYDAPLHAPYVLVVGVDNKIHIVNITSWLQLTYMGVVQFGGGGGGVAFIELIAVFWWFLGFFHK